MGFFQALYLWRLQKLVPIASVEFLLAYLPLASGQQAYCWDPCAFNCPKVGPRLCPPESILTYYDCCDSGCCQYIKWPNLLFMVIIIFLLLAGCGCCFFFLFTDARHRMFAKRNQERQQKQEAAVAAATAANSQRARSSSIGRPNLHHKHSTIV
uniref:Uncharacterized protein n=1 Tax=Ditylenchus dipsaci TaxID=166011 RepID=A0A915DZY4_9BILA